MATTSRALGISPLSVCSSGVLHFSSCSNVASSARLSSLMARRGAFLQWRLGRGEVKSGTELAMRARVATRASVGNGRDNAVESLEPSYVPHADFYKIDAIIRPWRLPHVASALVKMGIRGVTVSDVRGFGSQGGSRERHAGSEFSEDSFVTKVKLEIVVSKDQVEVVISTIIDNARTGEIGDGKVFISPVVDVVRVRTGERGFKAERMAGGRAEILSSKEN